ncbi:hypothetical protein SERLA73DRAFT_176460 [Serpula lacrymans var. lacrymans S7.3]|uniref:Uncharacterized protein n=2 Tax=Serpula lacrymans var. lacrymans TaxID=341189 RepID=F8PMZ7_SERL3|nr:uncharacterized protein SERLADRAFT_459327 [Serpula lacrymans var. lacrymans S7.9]EGO02979.1 hypothetical protein SERLA73DRAFT_176460 [Serpula lacrymans var. lacrymans S7.3]EGO28661.1 hypothetical protein SERLADRAFT_459327 [Serpula lacrymans var. lacrymans S7.9]
MDLADDNGLTPLVLARSLEAVAMVKLLEEYTAGSKFNSIDKRENRTTRMHRTWTRALATTGMTVVGHQTIHRIDIARPLLCSIPLVYSQDDSHYQLESHPPSIPQESIPSPD